MILLRKYPPHRPHRRYHKIFTDTPKPKDSKFLLVLWYIDKFIEFLTVLALALPGLALIGFIIILIIVII